MAGLSPVLSIGVEDAYRGAVPDPRPAVKTLPESYRRMSTSTANEDGSVLSTVKSCMPFFDAMTYGWTIPLPFQMTMVRQEDGSMRALHRAVGAHNTVAHAGLDHHPARQMDGYFDGSVLKVLTPYYVRTRRGWGILVVPPMNRGSLLIPFSGLVNTNRYRAALNFPCYYSGPTDDSVEIDAGTPLAQVFAVRMKHPSSVLSTVARADAVERDKTGARCGATRGYYKQWLRGV